MTTPILAAVMLAFCCLTNPVIAGERTRLTEHGPAGITVHEPLMQARGKLLQHGWKPVRLHAADGYAYSGAELQLTGRKIFEVDACSADSSRCILVYKKNGTCLRVDTIGERLADMTVTRWVHQCPNVRR